MTKRADESGLVGLYLDVKGMLLKSGFADEIDRQYDCSIEHLTEPALLREAAWVVLTAGFKERIVAERFAKISEAFLYWRNASEIVRNQRACINASLAVFGNVRKTQAIMDLCSIVSDMGFPAFVGHLRENGVGFLRTLPYMGPITSLHLAKNIGFRVAKPDRHLVRIASILGFDTAAGLCSTVSQYVGDPISVVDGVFWRYATLDRGYSMLASPR